jgi:hypothetical protein
MCAAGIDTLSCASAGDELWWEVAPDSLKLAVQTLHRRFIEE